MKKISELIEKEESTLEKGNAKINLSLDVTGRLDNGYHLVKMIMESLELSDVIMVTCAKTPGIRLTCDLSSICVGDNIAELSCGDDNLIVKAAKAILREAGMTDEFELDGTKIGLDIRLVKNIPMAAGLAGGSTDAAATMRAINRMFELGFTEDKLCEIGVKLGADIPYCIKGGSYLAEGIGEKLTKLPMPPMANVLLIKPAIDVSTKYVYENLDSREIPSHPDVDGMIGYLGKEELSEKEILTGITDRLGNVLRDVTIGRYPLVREIEEFMCKQGALGAMMSGSGPTVFGIYEDEASCKMAEKAAKEKFTDSFVAATRLVG